MEQQQESIAFSTGDQPSKTFVEYRLTPIGRDWILQITGGEAHVGSLALSEKEQIHQITLQTHKESEIVQKAILGLKDLFQGELLVIGGIHYDDIQTSQIIQIEKNCDVLLTRVKDYIVNRL